MATADVTVRGAGIFGLSVAYSCARKGARVRIVDPNGVAAGASGGIVGALAPHVPEQWNSKKEFQRDSLLMAPAFWADIEERSGMPTGYARTGRVQPLADAAAVQLAQDRAAGAKEHWQGHADWTVQSGNETAWQLPSPTGLVVFDTLSALIHPRSATTALAQAVANMGGEVVADASDEGAVVWATGWQGLNDLTARHTRLVGAGVKGQAALLAFDAVGAPQVFADGLHMIPHSDGTTAVGSTTERTFDAPDTTDDALDDVIARARVAVPDLARAPVLTRWAGVRPRARSRAPMVGVHPFVDGAFVANGGFKIGFGMAPKIGKILADLMLEGRDTIPAEFKPESCL